MKTEVSNEKKQRGHLSALYTVVTQIFPENQNINLVSNDQFHFLIIKLGRHQTLKVGIEISRELPYVTIERTTISQTHISNNSIDFLFAGLVPLTPKADHDWEFIGKILKNYNLISKNPFKH